MNRWILAFTLARTLILDNKNSAGQVFANSAETFIIVTAILIYTTLMRGSVNVTQQLYFHPLLFFGIGFIVFISFIKVSLVSAKMGLKACQFAWIGSMPIWFLPAAAAVDQLLIYLTIFLLYLVVCSSLELVSLEDIPSALAIFVLGQLCAFCMGLIIWITSFRLPLIRLVTRIAYRRGLLLLSATVTTSLSLERYLGSAIYYNPLLQTIELIRECVKLEYSTLCNIYYLLDLLISLCIAAFLLVWFYRVELRSSVLAMVNADSESSVEVF